MTDLSRTFVAKGDDPIAIRQALLKIRQATKDLGTMAAQNSDAVDITGGTIVGTDITVGAGKTLDVSDGTFTLADKQVDISKIGTAETVTANVLRPDGSGGVAWGAVGNSSGNIVSRPADNAVGADTVSEITSGAGVTADGVLLKDNDVQADEVRTDIIIEKTATNGVVIEGITAKDSFLEVTEISAPDSPAVDKLRIYAKDNTGVTKLYIKDSAGTETELGAGSGSVAHNDTTSKQGGTTSEYYHLTSAQHAIATQAASATVAGYVDTSAQTIAGVKTFSSSPIVPTPTTADQAVPKSYVDGLISPIYINMLTKIPDAIGQGTWVLFVSNDFLYRGVMYNSTNATGDSFAVNVSVPAGTYTLDFNAPKAPNAAKLDVFVDATKILDAYDLYATSVNALNIKSTSGITLTAGKHVLKFTVNGKNASSSAYYVNFNGIQLTRTGA